jgi:hypothetical protein
MDTKKRKHFEKYAKGRTSRAIKALRVLRKSANHDTNEFTTDEAQQILGSIEKELLVLTKLFAGGKPKTEELFDFTDGGEDEMIDPERTGTGM